MNHTIKSRKFDKTFEFFRNDSDTASYVYLESPGKSGCLGKQICIGGGFGGSTLKATMGSFKAVCTKWYKQHIKYNNEV